jgi:hypothetical protein
VVERLRMPSLGGAAEWLNTEPLGPARLRGLLGGGQVRINWTVVFAVIV